MEPLQPPSFDDLKKQAIIVLNEMLIDRGYTIIYNDQNLSKNENYVIKASKGNDCILCFINDEEKVNIQGIKERIPILNKENANKCIIVYRLSVTSTAKKSIEAQEHDIELFAIHELQLNITRHRLVPRHCRVTAEEKEELDKNFKGKLPFILSIDPVSKYYAFKKGEYIRIHRKDGSMIYRVVK